MAKILCITSGRMAMFNATSALASRLAAAGHSVVYASPDDLASRAENRGLAYVQLPPSRLPQRGNGSVLERWRSREARRNAALADLGVDDLTTTIKEIDPDLVLIDIELHAHIICTLALPIRLGLLCTFISIRKRRGLPPLHSPVVPGNGWRGRAVYSEWLWLRFRIRKAAQRYSAWIADAGVEPVSLLRDLVLQQGIAPSRFLTAWQWLIPVSYKRLPIVSLRAAELDFRPDSSPQMRFCGPMIEERRKEILGSPDTSERLKFLYERRRRGDSEALIFCSLSSFAQADPSFIRRVLAAVVDVPEWDLVLSLGGTATEYTLDLPRNVHVFRWVPQLCVLEQVDAAVINAGFGISDCIFRGVPMVVYSLKRNDQNGNAARVVYHGLGIAGDKDRDDPEKIRARIQAVLTDVEIRRRVEDLRRRLGRYDDDDQSLRVVAELLDERGDTDRR